MKLNIKAFAFTCAFIWGFGLLLYTWWMLLFGNLVGQKTLIGNIYLGYRVTFAGSFIGLIWAFADGLIAGAIFAWLYNLMIDKCCKKTKE